MPGVPVEVFEAPANTALRFEAPDPRLAPFISDYYVLDSEGPDVMGHIEYAMPGGANFRFYLGENQINVTIGNRVFAPAPRASLYGPTSRVLRHETFGGVTVGIGITPLGWARWIGRQASNYCDRITPLNDVLPDHLGQRLYDLLAASDQDLSVKPLLDAFFLDHLGPPHPDESKIRRVMTLIVDETGEELAQAAARVNLTPQQLRTTALRHFGFPPKRLLRRARFLRSLLRMYAAGGEADYSLRARSYFDVSHFLRDADEFLGMTPKRFMAMQTPYLRHVLKVRAAVLGVPVQALAPPEGGEQEDATKTPAFARNGLHAAKNPS